MNQELEEIKTPEYVSLQFKLAGLGSRASALILDMLILGIVDVAVIILFVLASGGNQYVFLFNAGLYIGLFILFQFVLFWGYFFVCEYFFAGKTIGKKLLGIRVIQDNGMSLTFLSSAIRNLLRIIDMLPAAYFLGMIMVFFHGKHKRIGDITAGTIVVCERRTKPEKQTKPIEKEIERRGLSGDALQMEELELRAFTEKDWKLIKTYSQRLLQLPMQERNVLTRKVANLLLPKAGLDPTNKKRQELEDLLLAMYLKLKDEWEYEL